MEAPFDATKSKVDLLNFSGSASDMMAAMAAAGIVASDAEQVESNYLTSSIDERTKPVYIFAFCRETTHALSYSHFINTSCCFGVAI